MKSLIIAAIILMAGSVGADARKQCWEYWKWPIDYAESSARRIFKKEYNKENNFKRAVNEGWELISVYTDPSFGPGSPGYGNEIYVMKRSIPCEVRP